MCTSELSLQGPNGLERFFCCCCCCCWRSSFCCYCFVPLRQDPSKLVVRIYLVTWETCSKWRYPFKPYYIKIIYDTFLAHFRPPPPPCVIQWHCSVSSPVCDVTFTFFKKLCIKQAKIPKKYGNFWGKCHVTLRLTLSLPSWYLVTLSRPPSPKSVIYYLNGPLPVIKSVRGGMYVVIIKNLGIFKCECLNCCYLYSTKKVQSEIYNNLMLQKPFPVLYVQTLL